MHDCSGQYIYINPVHGCSSTLNKQIRRASCTSGLHDTSAISLGRLGIRIRGKACMGGTVRMSALEIIHFELSARIVLAELHIPFSTKHHQRSNGSKRGSNVSRCLSGDSTAGKIRATTRGTVSLSMNQAIGTVSVS